MILEMFIITTTAILTAVGVNYIVSVRRRHQTHEININVQHILDDARDVSLSVTKLTRQLGGRC